jgi:putative DNA primase/helicase
MTSRAATEANAAAQRLGEVWRSSGPDSGRIEAYLASRGLPPGLMESITSDVIRFHPALSFHDSEGICRGDFPAMVAKVTDVSGQGVTLHRTYLDPYGPNKLDLGSQESPKKLMTPRHPGATKGASIKLAPAGSVLGVAEGIETALAVRAATGQPCWSCVSARGLEEVVLPEQVRTVHVWADNDASV